MDIEFVALTEAEDPDAFAVAFDVIYSGETWCRSEVLLARDTAAGAGCDEAAMTAAARDALLDLLAVEPSPVSLRLRLTPIGVSILDRAAYR